MIDTTDTATANRSDSNLSGGEPKRIFGRGIRLFLLLGKQGEGGDEETATMRRRQRKRDTERDTDGEKNGRGDRDQDGEQRGSSHTQSRKEEYSLTHARADTHESSSSCPSLLPSLFFFPVHTPSTAHSQRGHARMDMFCAETRAPPLERNIVSMCEPSYTYTPRELSPPPALFFPI